MILLAWVLLVASFAGLGVTLPLWLMDRISERAMLGVTLVLSWAALQYTAGLFLYEARKGRDHDDGAEPPIVAGA